MAFDNFLAEGEADSGSVVGVPGVQPLKDGEDTVAKFRINSDSIVFDRQGAEMSVRFGPDVNPWRFLISELYGISDEVLKQLCELSGVALDHRQ